MLAQALWDSPATEPAFNFGPPEDDARPVGWLVERLAELWPGGVRWALDDGPHPHAVRLRADLARLRAVRAKVAACGS